MKKYTLWLSALFMGAIMVTSCKKNDDVKALQPSRAFKPTTATITPSGTTVKIDWKASLFSEGTGVTYTVEISKNQDFSTLDYTTTTDALTLTLTDVQLVIGQPYYMRIKANATPTTAASNGYAVSKDAFTMPGILQVVGNADLTSRSVNLKWLDAEGLTRITVAPAAGGVVTNVALTPADVTAKSKLVTGLSPDVAYRAEIYAGDKIKGFTTFRTPLFNREITTSDNLIDVINNAANNDIIGLADGTYDMVDATKAFVNTVITQKMITLQSKSGDPAKVKVRFKQIDIKGSGAGFGAKGITFEGNDGTTANGPAPYFLNLVGLNADADNATFANINIDGCVVTNVTNAFLRGNRVSATGGFVIGNIIINNSVISKINQPATAGFNTIELSKVQFTELKITNSTFTEVGRALVVATTALTSTPVPQVNIDRCTFNSFGGANMFVLVDANTNSLKVNVTNNIFGNIPKVATGAQGLLRGTGANGSYTFTNNNIFNAVNLSGAALPVANSATNATTTANLSEVLNWTANTVDFTLPTTSPLRTASTNNGPIGDPRWAK